MTKKTLTIKEKYIVMQYIEQHCTKPPDHHYAMWDSIAKDDQNVADLHKPSMPNINATHVRGMRQELGLLLEPSRIVAKNTLDALLATVEQLQATLKEHEARIAALEDKYTTPRLNTHTQTTAYIEQSEMLSGASDYKLIDRASDKAVAKVIDPLVPPTPSTLSLYRKGKHRQ